METESDWLALPVHAAVRIQRLGRAWSVFPRAVVLSLALHGLLIAGFLSWKFPKEMPLAAGGQVGSLNVLPGEFIAVEGPGEQGGALVIPGLEALKTEVQIDAIPVSAGAEPAERSQVVSANSMVLLGSGPGLGAEPRGSFYQIPLVGRKIVYVIDASASMSQQGAWRAACRELLSSLATLPADTKIQVIIYNAHARPLLPSRPGWMEPDAETLARVVEALRNHPVEGTTDHWPALQLGLSLEPDLLVFLTDADDLGPELLPRIYAINRGKAVIHTVELFPSRYSHGDMPMQRLARMNRGQYRAVNPGGR